MGQLESFDRDWSVLCTRELGVSDSRCRMDETIGHHQSSASEEDKWTPVNQRTLFESPSALRALCLILLPDFACFSYPLPGSCLSVVAKLEKDWRAAGLGERGPGIV